LWTARTDRRSSHRSKRRASAATAPDIIQLTKSFNPKKLRGAQYTVQLLPTNPQLLKLNFNF